MRGIAYQPRWQLSQVLFLYSTCGLRSRRARSLRSRRSGRGRSPQSSARLHEHPLDFHRPGVVRSKSSAPCGLGVAGRNHEAALEPAHTALDDGGRLGFYFSRGFRSLAWDVSPFAWARSALAWALSPSAQGLWALAWGGCPFARGAGPSRGAVGPLAWARRPHGWGHRPFAKGHRSHAWGDPGPREGATAPREGGTAARERPHTGFIDGQRANDRGSAVRGGASGGGVGSVGGDEGASEKPLRGIGRSCR